MHDKKHDTNDQINVGYAQCSQFCWIADAQTDKPRRGGEGVTPTLDTDLYKVCAMSESFFARRSRKQSRDQEINVLNVCPPNP